MRLALLCLGLLLSACSCPTDKPAVEPDEPAQDGPPPVPVERIRGELTVDADGGLHIAVCGGGEPLKVLGSAKDELLEALAGLEHRPEDGSVPVEVIGATRDQPGGGGMISVESLLIAMPPGSTGLCELDASYLYTAHGNEPFWGVRVVGTTLVFSSPDLDAPLELPAEAARVPGRLGPMWRSLEGSERSLQLQLDPGRCWDDMSGAAYPFRATAILDDATLTGCAHQGWAAQGE